MPPPDRLAAAIRSAATLAAQIVDRPFAWSGEDQIEEDEAIQRRQLALIDDGVGALGRMHHPVGHGHEAGQDEGRAAREQAQDDQDASDQFDRSGPSDEGRQVDAATLTARRKMQDLLRPMLKQKQTRDDTEKAKHTRCPGC